VQLVFLCRDKIGRKQLRRSRLIGSIISRASRASDRPIIEIFIPEEAPSALRNTLLIANHGEVLRIGIQLFYAPDICIAMKHDNMSISPFIALLNVSYSLFLLDESANVRPF